MSIPLPTWMKPNDKDALSRLRQAVACLYVNRSEVCDEAASARYIRYGRDGFHEPSWLDTIRDADERERARLRFYVRLAAFYASPEGTLTRLSTLIGLNPRVLSTYTCRGAGRRRVSARVARAIEKASGGVVDKARLCPEAFAD